MTFFQEYSIEPSLSKLNQHQIQILSYIDRKTVQFWETLLILLVVLVKLLSPSYMVLELKTIEITSALQAARKSPLADEMFKIEGVKSILLGPDFLTITKGPEISWPQLNPQIYAAIMDFFTTGKNVLFESSHENETDTTATTIEDSEVTKMIQEILDTRIRPTIQDDGGDVEFRGFNTETGWVKLKLVGACRTCSSSTITLRNGIENMLMHYIPEVKGVEQVLDDEELVAQKEFNKFEIKLQDLKTKSKKNE
jgi:NFU1 iron-sulfur cluster scaffold homolog, mitochondrial